MRLVPNMTVVAPSDVSETLEILDNISKLNGPLYIRDSNSGLMDIQREPFVWGKNECIVKGDNVAILSYGTILDVCLKVSKKLSQESFSHAVYNMRFLKPIDKETLHEIFDKFKKIFVIEDHINMGALGSIIKEFAWENHKDNKITFINLRETFFRPGNFNDALQSTELASGKIYGKIINS